MIRNGSNTPRLLIVDDNVDNIRILALNLESDFRVQVAMDGQTALELLARPDRADLVLLDVSLPGMDGFEVCRRIRASDATADVPVIFLTGHEETEYIIQGFNCGGNDYVLKPFEVTVLLARVMAQLELYYSRRELKEVNKELRKLNDELLFLSNTDGLLKIANRRYFDKTLLKEWRRNIRGRHEISLLIIDVDFFKRYNDTYGHLQGDDCLKQIAGIISASVRRTSDLVARYGGEELAVILPDTPLSGAIEMAEYIRKSIIEAAIPHDTSMVSPVLTVSIGAACLLPQMDMAPDMLIRAADEALYQAKGNGRNRTWPMDRNKTTGVGIC